MNYLLEIGVYIFVFGEIPQCETAELIIVIPVIKEFGDVFLPGFVLVHLGIVQVERVDFANHERFDAGFVSALGDGISFRGDAELTALVVESVPRAGRCLD
jgi:hypothetical protein